MAVRTPLAPEVVVEFSMGKIEYGTTPQHTNMLPLRAGGSLLRSLSSGVVAFLWACSDSDPPSATPVPATITATASPTSVPTATEPPPPTPTAHRPDRRLTTTRPAPPA